ncbi:MAG: DUF222 domain-containing protein, partial [Actinomycetota bacterium]
MYVRVVVVVREAVAALREAVDAVLAADLSLSTAAEVVELLDELEAVGCRLPAARHRGSARLLVETTPQQMGAKNWKDVLAIRWRISGSEAHRRLTEAALLAPRQ